MNLNLDPELLSGSDCSTNQDRFHISYTITLYADSRRNAESFLAELLLFPQELNTQEEKVLQAL